MKRLIFPVALLFLLFLSACGSGNGNAEFQKIAAVDQVFTIDDFVDVGFKKGKQYNVEGLTEATDAWIGFFSPAGTKREDYELRFYRSHASAVKFGAQLADEATGDLFRERKDSQTWTEGQKDRWRSGNVTAGSTGGVTAGPGPIYGDFAIYGNVVMLCAGANAEHALERCEDLTVALAGGA